MEPTIYKPGTYKTPGVYKGAGGVYKGRGVYKDDEKNIYGVLTLGGRNYETVVIGDKEFTRENIAYEYNTLELDPLYFNSSSKQGSYYNRDKATYSDYGILYNYLGAVELENYLSDGWRLPLKSDFEYLEGFLTNEDYKSLNYWSNPGNGKYLNLIPSGYRAGDTFAEINDVALLHTNSQYNSNYYAARFYGSYTKFNYFEWNKANSAAVRLVRDL